MLTHLVGNQQENEEKEEKEKKEEWGGGSLTEAHPSLLAMTNHGIVIMLWGLII